MGDKGRKDKIKQEKQHKIAHEKKLHSKELEKVHGGIAGDEGTSTFVHQGKKIGHPNG